MVLKHLSDVMDELPVPIGNPARECLGIKHSSEAVAVADLCQQAPRGNVMRTCMDEKAYCVPMHTAWGSLNLRYQYIQGSRSDDGFIRQSRAWLASAWI